jgi:hypothetical protein
VVAGSALAAVVALAPARTGGPLEATELDPSGALEEHGCTACHVADPGAPAAAPSFEGLRARAAQRLASPDYVGGASDVESYFMESVLDHCADPLPGWDCSEVPRHGNWLSLEDATRLVEALGRIP